MEKEVLEKIKYLKEVQKLNFRQIGEVIGLGRKTVSRLYYMSSDKSPNVKRPCKLDEYYSLIAGWFKEYPNLKAVQIWDRLKDRHLSVDYSTVVKYTRLLRTKKQKVYFPLSFMPGEEAQVDWFHENHPSLGKLYGFIMVLSYSRMVFISFFLRSSFEFFIEGHLQSLAYFKGITRAMRYDNLKSVVLKRQPRVYNASFLEFARHYGFEIRLCNVACGNEKGRVERSIRSFRETFLNQADHYQDLKALNQGTLEWVSKKNSTIHRVTLKTPISQLSLEKLKPLPLMPWNNEMILPPQKATKTGLVAFDTNLYSIPDYLIRETFSLHITPPLVQIHNSKGKCIAKHPRSFKRHQTFFNPVHRSFKQISSEAKRERIYIAIKNLDPLIQHFLEQNSIAGEDPYSSAYLIFKLLRGHSRETILSGIRTLLKQKQYSIMALYRLLNVFPDCDPVSPQNQVLLSIDYKPRSLEEYHS